MMLKKGIQVKVISGKDKGKTGEILEINRSQQRVKIKSINLIKKHLKPTKENKGGIITKESFIHQSNIKNIDAEKKIKKEQHQLLQEIVHPQMQLLLVIMIIKPVRKLNIPALEHPFLV